MWRQSKKNITQMNLSTLATIASLEFVLIGRGEQVFLLEYFIEFIAAPFLYPNVDLVQNSFDL